MTNGEHILNLSARRGDFILTNGHVFASCSRPCTWNAGPMTREHAREAHREHFDRENAKEQEARNA